MGFYVRKSLRAGPFRFNFSRSGVGVSVGVPGFRIGTGPRGSYVHVGAGRLHYRSTMPPARQAGGHHASRDPHPPRVAAGHGFERIDSGNVLRMVDTSSAALLEEINAKHRRSAAWPWVALAAGFLGLAAAGNGAPPLLSIALVLIGTALSVRVYLGDQAARTVVLFYDLEPDAAEAFDRLHDAFAGVASAQRAWNVDARARVEDAKRNAGASQLLQRAPVRLYRGAPGIIATNVEVPVIPAGDETLYFFPDRLLVFAKNGVGAVPYESLRIGQSTTRFIETDPVPGDARVVGRTWQYVNKGGGPDRRFRDNPELPVVLYDQLHFTSGSGLNELLQLSRSDVGGPFCTAVARLAALTEQAAAAQGTADEAPLSSSPPVPPEPGPVAPRPEPRQESQPASATARWIPPGQEVEVAGHRVRDGMVYWGRGLRSLRGGENTEPALLDPQLPVSRDRRAIEASSASYWPSYSDVSPGFRAKYLRWHHGGRLDPTVDLGCVFLFFYGIERRLLADGQQAGIASLEVAALLAEVERLLAIYGSQSSFRRYATRFLEVVRIRYGLVDLEPEAPPVAREGNELPLQLRAVLGRMAQSGTPVPPEWALAWVRLSPLAPLRIVAERCRDEFDALFRIRYRERFGDGMVVKPNRTALSLTYQPASASFAGQPVRIEFGDRPDVGVLKAPLDRLVKVADAVTAELDRYSRWVGRNGDGESLGALALLPAPILRKRIRRNPPPLVAEVANALQPEGRGTVPSASLVEHWPGQKPDRLTRKEAESVAEFLEKIGIGIAPDARHTGINFSQSEAAVLFLLPTTASEPGPDFGRATLLLTLAAAVAGTDEIAQREEAEIEQHLESAYQLSEADRLRLRAHLDWLRVCPPGTAGLKKELNALPPRTREEIARALIAIAGADGHVSPAEVKALHRLYPLLGLDAKQVYADVHALAAGSGPVPVLTSDPAVEYAIPAPPAAPAEPAVGGLRLDLARLAAIQDETREVTRVLSAVFAGEEPAPAADPVPQTAPADGPATPAKADPDEEAASRADHLPGLDAAHSALVRALGGNQEWEADAFAALAERFGLLPAGAMETINDAAFELCGEPLLEGSDPVEVNPFAREELFA